MMSTPSWPRAITLVSIALLAWSFAAACGSGSDARVAGVTIEPLASATSAARTPPVGGKPATPPAVSPTTAAAVDGPAATETPVPIDEDEPADEPAVAPTETPAPRASDGSTAPAEGRWINVDVTTYVVRLMDGATVVREIAPVGVGEQVDTGEYASTQTGLFYVNSKIEELAYDPPYDTYISHWVGFDETKANGFHSFLKDANGAVVDPSTGRVSNGCIRTGEAEAVFAFAEIGMPVWVHW